jgi:fumarate reductase flavoprotein subunit
MKKFNWVALLLGFVLMFSLAACDDVAQVEPAKPAYTAGTYTATAAGHNGDVTLEATFDDKSIVSVNVLSHVESAGISDAPLARIPQKVVADQTLAVDAITGATFTSKALLAAIEDCVTQAGGDVVALKANTSSGNTVKTETEISTDVVVVGAGGTGLAAAASAHQHGAEVIVLEKLAAVGGSTARSGGGISATGTKFQEELGIKDTKESWTQLWKERQATSNPNGMYPDYTKVDKFMDAAVVTTEWLFDYVGHKYGSVAGFGLDPVKRIHFPEGGQNNGGELIQNIEKFVLSKGIEIYLETPAVDLITNDKGDVVGVIAENNDTRFTINAKKVILASGGYAQSEELLERFIPEAAGTKGLSYASPGSTGDGLLMAEKLGAAFYEEPWVIGVGIDSKIPGTGIGMDWKKMYVNEKGERFMNEEVHYAVATNGLLNEKGTKWLVLDATEANAKVVATLEAAMPSEEVVKADSFEALAKAMNVPVDTFTKTMAEYNEGAKAGKDKMGKSANSLVAVDSAPYYAMKVYPKTMGTFAGVKTNDNYQVVREDGSIINNLYAGGEMANKALYNQVYMSGSAVQFALTSGRLAGEHAALNIK